MANGNGNENGRAMPNGRRWLAAILIFLVGVGLLLLAVFGPVLWGATFDAGSLKTPAFGLIVVSVYVLLGVSLPALLSGKEPENGANRRRNDERKDGGDG